MPSCFLFSGYLLSPLLFEADGESFFVSLIYCHFPLSVYAMFFGVHVNLQKSHGGKSLVPIPVQIRFSDLWWLAILLIQSTSLRGGKTGYLEARSGMQALSEQDVPFHGKLLLVDIFDGESSFQGFFGAKWISSSLSCLKPMTVLGEVRLFHCTEPARSSMACTTSATSGQALRPVCWGGVQVAAQRVSHLHRSFFQMGDLLGGGFRTTPYSPFVQVSQVAS